MDSSKKVCIFIYSFLYALAWILFVKFEEHNLLGSHYTITMNRWFRELWHYDIEIGHFRGVYFFSQLLGGLLLAVCIFWAGIGVVQFIKNKDINSVDKDIFAATVLYIIALIKFGFLRLLDINCGMIMLIAVSMSSTMYLVGLFLENNKKMVLILRIICVAVMVIGVIVRTICGINLLSDIIAGILVSIPSVALYSIFWDV